MKEAKGYVTREALVDMLAGLEADLLLAETSQDLLRVSDQARLLALQIEGYASRMYRTEHTPERVRA
jgi:hypothetical protein